MIAATRFASHFEYFGEGKTHFGLFPDCGPVTEKTVPTDAGTGTTSCC